MRNIFTAFKDLNVLIVGDVMIDRYLHGKVERISPEAPVPVVHLKSQEDRLGGAANVALNIAALGATPYLCSVVGKDEAGQDFLQLLERHRISGKYIQTSTDRPTTIKSRILANHQQLLRVDKESTGDLNSKEEVAYLKIIKNILQQQQINVIIFQDYNKGVLSLNVIREVMLQAIRRDIPTAVDPKFKNFTTYKHAHLFKPNLVEVNRYFQNNITATIEDLRQAAQQLQLELKNKYTLITLSEQGLFLQKKSAQEGIIFPTQVRQIADVCGAGDSVISVAALALALKLSTAEIALLSNLAGGQVCECPGVVPINVTKLEKEYKASAVHHI